MRQSVVNEHKLPSLNYVHGTISRTNNNSFPNGPHNKAKIATVKRLGQPDDLMTVQVTVINSHHQDLKNNL